MSNENIDFMTINMKKHVIHIRCYSVNKSPEKTRPAKIAAVMFTVATKAMLKRISY